MTLDQTLTLAAQATTRAGFYLHAASSATDRAEKARLMKRAFHLYATLTPKMNELQQLAPNCAREGFEEAAKIRDFVEAQG
jgi:protein-arginine kinase activator protein McsA